MQILEDGPFMGFKVKEDISTIQIHSLTCTQTLPLASVLKADIP